MTDVKPPKRRPGRPPRDGTPMSDTMRAAMYRARQKISGGLRLTLKAEEADLMREVLRLAIEQGQWSDDDRERLADLRKRTARESYL